MWLSHPALSNKQGQTFTLTEAAKVTHLHRTKIRRALDNDKFANATKDAFGIWKIPLGDLLEAGFSVLVDEIPDNVIDLREGIELPESQTQALEVLSGFQRSMHELAECYAESNAARAVAETKLEFVEGQRDDARAEAERLRQELEESRTQRRRWFRRRAVTFQPTATAGGGGAVSS